MKILAATGSFKDVYTSIESCEMIKSILSDEHEVITAPLCDGGEYTYDVLKYYYGQQDGFKEIFVDNVINPCGKPITARYIAIGDEAYVISSEVLHLGLQDDKYKNPLTLTEYGLGQLLRDAVDKGFKTINLCLGGTSTVGYGIGTAQALGAEIVFRDGYEEKSSEIPIVPADYLNIEKIIWNNSDFKDIKLNVLNDGITKSNDLHTVNPLKIGKAFHDEKETILKTLDENAEHIYKLTGLGADDAYSGNGGAVYYAVENLFDAQYFRGAQYFCNLFEIENKIKEADIVITGEGRYDNPHLKKLPITIAELAKSLGKPVIFACGSRDNSFPKADFIDTIVSCDDYYKTHDVRSQYDDEFSMYRELTPLILKEELRKVLND